MRDDKPLESNILDIPQEIKKKHKERISKLSDFQLQFIDKKILEELNIVNNRKEV